jgi:putative transposase
VSHETVRQWARKFGQAFANQIRRRLPCPGDKWQGLRMRFCSPARC